MRMSEHGNQRFLALTEALAPDRANSDLASRTYRDGRVLLVLICAAILVLSLSWVLLLLLAAEKLAQFW